MPIKTSSTAIKRGNEPLVSFDFLRGRKEHQVLLYHLSIQDYSCYEVKISRSSTHFTSMTKQEKGKITDQINASMKTKQGLSVGRYKVIYRVRDE